VTRTSLKHISIVFRKEAVDNLRDRRSLISALITTLITPALLLSLIMVIGKTIFSQSEEKIVQLPIVGPGNAPGLVNYLKQNGVKILPAPDDPKAEVKNGNFDVILVIPEGYASDFTKDQPATIQMISDSSRTSAIPSIQKVGDLLDAYNNLVGSLRLMARGVNPVVLQTIYIEQVDVSTPQSQVMIFLNMMPFLLLITIFTGGMYVVIDTTAGERERNSLEPLLINPVSRWEFVLGKYAAALPFTTITLATTLSAFALGFNFLPIEQYIGRRLIIDFPTTISIFLICLPIILFATAIQMVVATYTRSFKEAQTYVSLMAFIPALPGAFLAFLPTRPGVWKMAIPTFGQQLLINQMLRGESIGMNFVLISTFVTILAALLLLGVAVRLYQREQILFGTR
jgi:sodium transport system permease protein